MADASISESTNHNQAELALVGLCEACGEAHNGAYGSGRFCSQKCARSVATRKNRAEISAKVSAALKGRPAPPGRINSTPRPTLRRDLTGFVRASELPRMAPSDLGLLAEDFVYYQLRRRGVDVYRPLYPKHGIDLLVMTGGVTSRCQVKATAAEALSVELVYSTYVDRKIRRVPYNAGEIDVFFLVDLLHEHVFVLPEVQLDGRLGRSLTMTRGSWVWRFKDRYDVIPGSTT